MRSRLLEKYLDNMGNVPPIRVVGTSRMTKQRANLTREYKNGSPPTAE